MYSKVNYEDVEAVGGGAMHFLRDPLDCDELGLTVVECPPDWDGKPHDHSGDGQEEVYLLMEGEATITVDGEAVDLEAGDALRVDPESERTVSNGDAESTFVIVGAP